MRTSLLVAALAVAFGVGGYQVLAQESSPRSSPSLAARYACPMKCEGDKTYEQPGRCPVCGMKLKVIESSAVRLMMTLVNPAEKDIKPQTPVTLRLRLVPPTKESHAQDPSPLAERGYTSSQSEMTS